MKRELRSVTLKASPVPPAAAPASRSAARRPSWRLGPLLLLYAAGFLLLELLLIRRARFSTHRRLVQVPEDAQRFALSPPDLEDAEFARIDVPHWMTSADGDVPLAEREHLSWLHAACTAKKQTVIPWQHGAPDDDVGHKQATLLDRGDPRVVEQLKQCPDVDIYLPDGIRGLGYCEDAVAFAKFLRSRLLPLWALEDHFWDPETNRSVMYYELCPLTPMLFFNHYWDSRPDRSEWPRSKPVYIMPNIEMRELTAQEYWTVDAVICRTLACDQRVKAWYAQEGNPRDAKVFYTRFTSSDSAAHAAEMLGEENVRRKNFAKVRFTHTAGSSPYKGTEQVLDCWLSHPNFPPLDLYVHENIYGEKFQATYDDAILEAPNVNLIRKRMDAVGFGQVLAETSFFLCPSTQEGYGHYIDQARASGGVIITTDAHPMNELISSKDMGVLVKTKRESHPDMLLGGAYQGTHGLRSVDGLVAKFSAEDLCESVEYVLKHTNTAKREAMAEKARRQYHEDTKFFAQRMIQLRLFAREMRNSHK
ncbi:homeobox and-type helix-turn-helix domain-containing protein [Phytophthora cinnamomi]|uniref:homeobox and-type helix-turn-helix domain-containing protein n=1 Tax=Phytophthora cinnamomi TaxID=4785 RepID=UPI003559DF39|nr:homeobox and-type helix-turn-helix domain-containing protein [Phytophthora cinnamomi]